jgi:DUF1680 family protein
MSVSQAVADHGRTEPVRRWIGPVDPTAPVIMSPLPFDAVRLGGGVLGDLQRDNGAVSVPRGAGHLEEQGAWANFDNVAAGRTEAEYHGPCFEDGEAYKWLEAVAWEAARTGDQDCLDWLAGYSERIGAAQADDGYLNTFIQAGGRATRYERLAWDHEIFNNGALIQSAVAQYRATGADGLLGIARRAADHLDATFGPEKKQGTCGHPLIEMALVELYRATGEQRYLALAGFFVDLRGRDLIDPPHGFGDAYHSDRIPVRETTVPEGHAVRAIYLAAGATDLAIEHQDHELLEQLKLQWQNMVEQKTYLTGGLGSRWEGEAFGDPYELPSDRSYAETCAAIAGIQWSWRLLLATGESRYADLIERQLYNAVLPGIGLDGDSYFYANALQLRAGAVASDTRMAAAGRQHWFGCSCCPTNLMRTLASLHAYVATTGGDALQLHQYASGTVRADLPAGEVMITVGTEYPWRGEIMITVDRTPDGPWALALRIPAWAEGATVRVGEQELPATAGEYHLIERTWRQADTVTLLLPDAPRLVTGHHRVDATRGCVAIERGPLVYAFEQVDQDQDVAVDDLVLTSTELTDEFVNQLGGVPQVLARARTLDPATGDPGPEAIARAVPYFRWANREIGPMRVWVPISQS